MLVTVIVSPSGSKSLEITGIVIGVPSGVVAVSALAIGASFSGPLTGNTSMYTVAVSHACGLPSSQIVYVKVSSPVNPALGV